MKIGFNDFSGFRRIRDLGPLGFRVYGLGLRDLGRLVLRVWDLRLGFGV